MQHRYQQLGFSLTELMVASVLSLLLLAGMLQIMDSSKKTYSLDEELSRLQENGRFALDQLSQDIRMSGYQGCADPAVVQVNIVANGVVAAMLDGGNGASNDSDTLTLQFSGGAGNQLQEDMANRASDIVIPTTVADTLAVGNVITIADCESIDVFKASTISPIASTTNSQVEHASGTYNSSGNLTKAYTKDARLIGFSTVQYSVAATARTNKAGKPIFALFRTDATGTKELVEGVEKMQILYGERVGISSASNIRYVTRDNVGDIDRVVAIRLALLLASNERVLDQDDANTYRLLDVNITPDAGGGLAVTEYDPKDRRLRRVFTTTVKLRNRR